jgi:hypothetical protein
VPARSGLLVSEDLDFLAVRSGWEVFNEFAVIPAEDVRDSDPLMFETGVYPTPLSDPPGVNELAAFIVSSVKEEIADTVSDANDTVLTLDESRTRTVHARLTRTSALSQRKPAGATHVYARDPRATR